MLTVKIKHSKVMKPLQKKEARKNKDNKGYTSNLYTLLNPKPKDKNSNYKNEVVSHRYQVCYPTDTLTIPILKRLI